MKPTANGSNTPLQFASTAFANNADIPAQYTCDGADVSPDFTWQAPPAGTRSFALIAEDPDAPGGTWIHWVLYDLPEAARSLPEAVPPDGTLASGAHQGRNDFGRVGYGGPCPPPGPAHRYLFTLYALDATLGLSHGATRTAVARAMRGHILAEATVIGRYRRAQGTRP